MHRAKTREALFLKSVRGPEEIGGLSLALSPIPAALLGVVAYALVIYSIRSLGLTDAWAYVRGLH
jgi:hypothetical protein